MTMSFQGPRSTEQGTWSIAMPGVATCTSVAPTAVVKRNGVRVSLHEMRVYPGVKGVTGGRYACPLTRVAAWPSLLSSRRALHHGVPRCSSRVTELPLDMVPDEVHLWSTFPLNSSGKVDRHRLAAEAGRVHLAEAAADSEPEGS